MCRLLFNLLYDCNDFDKSLEQIFIASIKLMMIMIIIYTGIIIKIIFSVFI